MMTMTNTQELDGNVLERAIRHVARTGLQGHQEPGLAVRPDPAHRPGPRLPPLAGAVGGYPAGPGLRHQGGRRP